MDLGSQDCIIGVKWLRQFRLQLDPYRNRLLWPTEYPSTYDASPPILMTLAQPKYHRTVELDIARRDALWEQDEARRNQSPTIHQIRGLLKIPKPRSVAPSSVKSGEVPAQLRSVAHPRIALISANGLHFNMKRKENGFFTTTLYEIDRVLEDKHFLEDDPDNLDLLRARLPPVYQAYQQTNSQSTNSTITRLS
jgi:hypothetical protein